MHNVLPRYYMLSAVQMTSRMLMVSTEIDMHKRIITLPKVSLQDLTTRKAAAAGLTATPLDCLRALLFYLTPEDRVQASRLLSDNGHVTVKFKNQSMRCRKLRVYNPKEAASAGKAEDFDVTNGEFLVDMYQELVA
jgi:hypothetical protein